MKGSQRDLSDLLQVRCPYCRKLAVRASRGARLEVKCARCGAMFEAALSDRPSGQGNGSPPANGEPNTEAMG